jgi:hypothetical protein
MEGIATDIAYPTMAFNGDLIGLIGSNPSGQSLTVYVNGGDNSLLQRCHYFETYGLDAPPFRTKVAPSNYGDDLKSSVHESCPEYNHISFADFLKKHDITFTMPDKSSAPTKYMNDSDADFLKRKNRFIPELNLTMGALDEDSIFKSLHAVLRSKAVTAEQQSMMNIDGALREWFAHGKEVYEKRRKEMQRVATAAGIAHGCSELHMDFEDQCALFRFKHDLDDPLDLTKNSIPPKPIGTEPLDY